MIAAGRIVVTSLFVGWLAIWLTLGTAIGAGPEPRVVRLALVNIADDIVQPLVPEFQKQSGIRAEIVYAGSDPFAVARSGRADLVVAHYGHPGVEPFVTEGLGQWPKPVFANQMALFGPPGDPANVKGMADAAGAFRRIADSRSNFVANASHGSQYLEQILWNSAGVTAFGSWYLDQGAAGKAAVETASKNAAYVLWGVAPFLRYKRKHPVALEPLVLGDGLFQRVMVSVVVLPASGALNIENAIAFERYLIAPATQARIRAFHYPGLEQQTWWPAGRHNGQED